MQDKINDVKVQSYYGVMMSLLVRANFNDKEIRQLGKMLSIITIKDVNDIKEEINDRQPKQR